MIRLFIRSLYLNISCVERNSFDSVLHFPPFEIRARKCRLNFLFHVNTQTVCGFSEQFTRFVSLWVHNFDKFRISPRNFSIEMQFSEFSPIPINYNLMMYTNICNPLSHDNPLALPKVLTSHGEECNYTNRCK